MPQRIVAIFLIFFTLSANFSRFFIYAGYQINRGYIASSLCENRDKPWLHCNGKCYLVKKIKLAEEKEKNTERQNGKSFFQEAFFNSDRAMVFAPILLQTLNTPYHPSVTEHTLPPILQPPQA